VRLVTIKVAGRQLRKKRYLTTWRTMVVTRTLRAICRWKCLARRYYQTAGIPGPVCARSVDLRTGRKFEARQNERTGPIMEREPRKTSTV